MKDEPILDAQVEPVESARKKAPPVDDEARKTALTGASLALVPAGERALYGSQAFFERASEELFVSTKHGLELAGAVYAREQEGRTVLVGLARKGTGEPGRVAIDPSWGSILWHTHPGLKGSLAAFSNEDLAAAKSSARPLLVIGFSGLSPDVITTLTLPLGLRGFAVSLGMKGLMALEKGGQMQKRLLSFGVAARVCYPSGRIQPVLRRRATPLQRAIDDMSYAVDRGVGVVERTGQRAAKELLAWVVGRTGR
jgi:hypothetical protein